MPNYVITSADTHYDVTSDDAVATPASLAPRIYSPSRDLLGIAAPDLHYYTKAEIGFRRGAVGTLTTVGFGALASTGGSLNKLRVPGIGYFVGKRALGLNDDCGIYENSNDARLDFGFIKFWRARIYMGEDLGGGVDDFMFWLGYHADNGLAITTWPAHQWIGFRYDTRVDGDLYAITKSGSAVDGSDATPNSVATLADATAYDLAVDMRDYASIKFYLGIDNAAMSLVATHTTNIPTASVNANYHMAGRSLSAENRVLAFNKVQMYHT